ncbi:RHS repeat-associated core domain-containing protein [Parazoarcus communis]|uniref:RHS repeat-associated core domain-containing protein n=1 Tax=Parazoarcus communis TaxID=41977 RepID=UPI001A9DD416|nr:RHS repeat-associated core domain-containing protein [Parazoarcus communis]
MIAPNDSPDGRVLNALFYGSAPRPESFAFDPAGNLLDPIDRAIGYPALDNRIAVFEDLRFDYDAHGNVTRRRKGAHELAELSWNAEHQLAQSTVTRHGVTQTTRYEYDALGRRIRKRDAFGATEYLWDGDLMIERRRNNKSALFLYEPDSFVPLATVQYNETYWYHCDQIGAPMELTDADGRIVWAADYRVWGEATVRKSGTDGRAVSGHTPAPPPIEQPFRFQGQQFDEETGLHYNRFRYYDPGVGIYVSQDPIKLQGGLNFYRYGTNPVAFVDPWGLEPVAFKTVGSTLCIKNKFPVGSAPAQELEEFTKRWNEQIKQNGGSMTRRVLTDQERRDSNAWKRGVRCQCPGNSVAGHVPDAAAGGPAIPRDWMAQMPETNGYVGGIVRHLPVGYTYDSVKLVSDLGGC